MYNSIFVGCVSWSTFAVEHYCTCGENLWLSSRVFVQGTLFSTMAPILYPLWLGYISSWTGHRVHTEWRLPILAYPVHPIMMEKSALADEGGRCTPTPSYPITFTYKVAVYAPAERADTLPLFHLYPICTPWDRRCSALCTVPICLTGGENLMIDRLICFTVYFVYNLLMSFVFR